MKTTNNRVASRILFLCLSVVLGVGPLVAIQNPPPQLKLTDDMRDAADRISAASMRDHLKFIASDELQGRNTPSPGLDRAADYIAAQFKKAGLQAIGDDGYFQNANFVQLIRDPKMFSLSLKSAKQTVHAEPGQMSFQFPMALSLSNVRLVRIDFSNPASTEALKPSDLEGSAVITELPDIQRAERARRSDLFQAQNAFLSRVRALKPALILSVDRAGVSGTGFAPGRVFDPDNRPNMGFAGTPIATIAGTAAANFIDSLTPGVSDATLSLNVAAPSEVPVKLRNVVGLLRGSDPLLRDTYVLVTAHYDHLGTNPNLSGPDKIYNGANDDGSGTVSVMEIAAAISHMKTRPKRSLIFMTVFGEEKGLLGSRYYGRHPLVSIEKTIADVNLEQVGRTDDSEGPQVGSCAMTGFDFSDLGEIFKAAGELVGIKVYKHPLNSDAYFGRSDNQALADQGVPAHTLGVAFEFPDYHGVGDHWDKIDYDNMAKVDRMVTVGLLMITNSPTEPKWNEANPKAARYLKAWRDRHAAATPSHQ